MFRRPKASELESKGILINSQDKLDSKKKHMRKTSQDLEAGLKKRMSLSQIQGLGILFNNGINFGFDDPIQSEEEFEYLNEHEHKANIAGFHSATKNE